MMGKCSTALPKIPQILYVNRPSILKHPEKKHKTLNEHLYKFLITKGVYTKTGE